MVFNSRVVPVLMLRLHIFSVVKFNIVYKHSKPAKVTRNREAHKIVSGGGGLRMEVSTEEDACVVCLSKSFSLYGH